MFYLRPEAINIDPSRKVLKADEYATYLNAEEIVRLAEEKAAQIKEDAKIAFENEKQRGFKEGVEEGNQKTSELLLETVDRSVRHFEEFENDVIEVVIKALRKIIGELKEKDLISRVVRTSLEAVRNQKKVTLIVSSEEAPKLREELNQILAEFPSINYIDIEADPRIEPGGCKLETEVGVVDATIETQLEAIRHSLTKAIK